MEKLIDILSTLREHDSIGERDFIEHYLYPLSPTPFFDDSGEVLAYVVDRSQDLQCKVMWSCHIDTMHHNKSDPKLDENSRQEVWVDDEGTAFVSADCDCLGADDGAGIWLMLEMIAEGVAGTYVFHRGEEKGCIGSSGMVVEHSDWLRKFTHAIAFDRRGTTSVITHQRGARACSDALGNKLISLFGMKHELDPTGVYTDTAEYMDIIPECVNISSGYYSEHSSKETLDTTYLLALRDAICSVDWLNVDLPVDRDPRDYEQNNWANAWGGTFSPVNSKLFDYEDDNYISEYERPSVAELLSGNDDSIVSWVKRTHVDDIAYAMIDMAYQLEEAWRQLDESDVGVQ